MSKAEIQSVVIGVEKKRIEVYNKHQPDYLPKLKFDERRLRAALDKKMLESIKYLYALLYVPKSSVYMFAFLRPVFQTNAAHFGNSSESLLFTMYAQDANDGRVLLGKMWVADMESEKTCSMFFDFIRKAYTEDWGQVTVISGQEKVCKNDRFSLCG